MDNIQYQADTAEFVTLDPKFRAAVNCVNLRDDATVARAQEIRAQVLEILLRGGNDLGRRVNDLKAMPTKSPVKLRALDFLTQRQSFSAAGNVCHKLEFTPAEKEQKKRAKELYRHCRYEEALGIGLEMIRANPNLINDYSMTGFITYCYYKLSDIGNALKYARISLKISPSADVYLRSKVHIAMDCAYELGLNEEVVEIIRKYPELRGRENTVARLAARAAYKIGSYEEALEATQIYISINKIKNFNDLYVLEIGIYSAVRLGQYETAFRICKMYLKQKCSLFVLQMAASLAARFHDVEAVRAYRAEAEKLERRIDNRACPEIVKMFDCDKEEE